jgi:hypothetical protein
MGVAPPPERLHEIMYHLRVGISDSAILKIGRTCPPPKTRLGRPPNIVDLKGQKPLICKKYTKRLGTLTKSISEMGIIHFY